MKKQLLIITMLLSGYTGTSQAIQQIEGERPVATFSDVQEAHTRINNIHTSDFSKVYKKISALYEEMNDKFAKVNTRIDNLHDEQRSTHDRISKSKAKEKQTIKKFLQ